MSEYKLEIKQLVDYPRCRIYRQFIQLLMQEQDICTGNCAGLFHYIVLSCYANFRTSYKRIEGISYTIAPGQWLCRIGELTKWFRVRFHNEMGEKYSNDALICAGSEQSFDGFKIINASWQPLYLVDSLTRRWTPEDILNWNVYNWQHWWPNSYATLNPVTVRPTDQVMGATLCAWGLNYEQLMSRLLENMPAMSERVWTVERKRTFEEYKAAFKKALRITASLVQDK